MYYLQSRYHNPTLGRFINADAFTSTGQGLLGNNMFAYCQNNPVVYVDPSGFLIILAADATEEQIAEYERAVAYIKTSETGRELIELLEASLFTITIVFVDDDQMRYDTGSNTIFFDTNSGLVLKDRASTQSAALGLAHEMGHAAQDILGILSNSYLTIDELESMNLEKYETPIAQELGEPTRGKYSEWSTTRDMQHSTHFRTAITVPRPWWHYVLFWNLFVPNTITTDHNLLDS